MHRILNDPDLAGYLFADPYLMLQPDMAFVAESAGKVLGYVVAALDSEEFYARWQLEWSPRFAASHPASPRIDSRNGDSQLRAFLHRPRLLLPPDLTDYPSHLHISLIAGARGKGVGRRLFGAVFHDLARAGSAGVQLGVQPGNTRAQAFYHAMGMTRLASNARHGVRFGRPLNG